MSSTHIRIAGKFRPVLLATTFYAGVATATSIMGVLAIANAIGSLGEDIIWWWLALWGATFVLLAAPVIPLWIRWARTSYVVTDGVLQVHVRDEVICSWSCSEVDAVRLSGTVSWSDLWSLNCIWNIPRLSVWVPERQGVRPILLWQSDTGRLESELKAVIAANCE